MSDETKCPKFGSDKSDLTEHESYDCESYMIPAGLVQSDRCRITQLEQQLAVAVAALTPFATYWKQLLAAERHPGESVVPLPPGSEDYRAAAEALKQIGATDDR